MTQVELTVWDASADSAGQQGILCRWNGYSESESTISLLRYVETHGERLRRRYLAWIHDLGETKIQRKRVIEHLALESGLSYWWLTLFVEKSPWKSPAITDALKLLALEEIVIQRRPSTLRLVSSNRSLHGVLKKFCENLDSNITYEWTAIEATPPKRFGPKTIFRTLPYPVQGAVALVRHLWTRWPFRQIDKSSWFGGARALFVCTFFFHIDQKADQEGHFYSRYWQGLHELIAKLGLCANWMQLYYPHAETPTPSMAKKKVEVFNRNRSTEGFHSFLDAFLSWPLVGRIVKRAFKLMWLSYRLAPIQSAFRPAQSNMCLWPIFQHDWFSSLRGTVMVDNLIWLELFDAALSQLPHQDRGLFICENQAWERALVHAWHKHQHGDLIGAVHSTVRFWDLRYFCDPRTVSSVDEYPIPRPQRLALNGKATVDAFLSVDYPRDQFVECEALRFMYLYGLTPRGQSNDVSGRSRRVLVLGDFIESSTTSMLKLLEAATCVVKMASFYSIKSHPNFIVEPSAYPGLQLKAVSGPLVNILPDFDIALAGGLTSAAVDAYVAGLRVIVVLQEDELNFSPLRGYPGVHFVRSAQELTQALQSAYPDMSDDSVGNEFFFLDPQLPRWQRLLSSDGGGR